LAKFLHSVLSDLQSGLVRHGSPGGQAPLLFGLNKKAPTRTVGVEAREVMWYVVEEKPGVQAFGFDELPFSWFLGLTTIKDWLPRGQLRWKCPPLL